MGIEIWDTGSIGGKIGGLSRSPSRYYVVGSLVCDWGVCPPESKSQICLAKMDTIAVGDGGSGAVGIADG